MSKASQLRQKAQNALKKGKVQEAVEIYRKLLQVEPRNPNLYNELGDMYLHGGDRVQAVSAFEQAIVNYEKVALYNNAVAVCKKILRIVPNRPDTVFKLGELKAKQKFQGEAAVFFTQYFDSVLEGGALPDGVQRRVEIALELVPASEEVQARGAEVFERAGHPERAAAVLASLIAGGGVDAVRCEGYRRRLDQLREKLGPDDVSKIDSLLNAAASEADAAAAESGVSGTESSVSGAGAAPAGDESGISGGEAAVAEADAGFVAAKEAGAGPASAAGIEGPGGSRPAEAFERRDAESSTDNGTEQAEPASSSGSETPGETGAGSGSDASGGGRGRPIPGNVVSEDLSDILEAEDAAQEAARNETERFTEEITSDVEEDDFRSHYDLGMAYIEMALYTEAIKELQISARSEQLQLRSFEMIGHCFLHMQNPRLAVKQLLRGLDIARVCGGDTLGIHYNLGIAYEELGNIEKAREHFEEVYIVDVTFREISEKMKKFSAVT